MPPQFPVPQRASARSRRGPVLAGAAVAVAVLIAVGVVLLTRGSPPHPPAAAGSSSPSAPQASSAAGTPAQTTQATQTAPAAGATIPPPVPGQSPANTT